MVTRLSGTDVVVVGLGAVGGVAVLPLADAGLDIVGLEAGSRLTSKDFAPDEIRNNVRDWPFAVQKATRETPTLRRNRSAQAFRSPSQPMMNGVGGTSLHYWGRAGVSIRGTSRSCLRRPAGTAPRGFRRDRQLRTGRSATTSWSHTTTGWSTKSACPARLGISVAGSIRAETRSRDPGSGSIRCRRSGGPAFWRRWGTRPGH